MVPTTPIERRPADRRPQRRGADRRRRILDAAVATFARRGTRRASIAEVAAEAGISAQGVLYHYGSKADLIAAVAADLEERRDALVRSVVGEGGLGMLRRFAGVGKAVGASRNLAMLSVVVAAENLDPDDPAHDLFAARRRNDQAMLRDGVAAGVARGEFRPDTDPDVVAEEMAALMAGAWLNWLLDPGGHQVERIYRNYFAGLERRLAVAGEGDR